MINPETKSIFEQYPQPSVIQEINEIGDPLPQQGPITKALDSIAKGFSTEEYIPLDDSASQEAQLDNLDATLSRRIHKLGRGVLLFTAGAVAAKYGSDLSGVSGDVLESAGYFTTALGALKLTKVGRIDSISEIHWYKSKVRRPDNFVRSMISPKLYDRARNKQLQKR